MTHPPFAHRTRLRLTIPELAEFSFDANVAGCGPIGHVHADRKRYPRQVQSSIPPRAISLDSDGVPGTGRLHVHCIGSRRRQSYRRTDRYAHRDRKPNVVTNTLDSGPGSLRQAILDAWSSRSRHDRLRHSRTRPVHHRALASSLTADARTSGPLTIDGTTQPGWDGCPIIEWTARIFLAILSDWPARMGLLWLAAGPRFAAW